MQDEWTFLKVSGADKRARDFAFPNLFSLKLATFAPPPSAPDDRRALPTTLNAKPRLSTLPSHFVRDQTGLDGIFPATTHSCHPALTCTTCEAGDQASLDGIFPATTHSCHPALTCNLRSWTTSIASAAAEADSTNAGENTMLSTSM